MSEKNSVLVIDDEQANCLMLISILSPEYTVYVRKSGQDGIDAAEELLPDVILLDILMPDMDGYEVIAALKSSPKAKNIPVIVITGLSPIPDAKALFEPNDKAAIGNANSAKRTIKKLVLFIFVVIFMSIYSLVFYLTGNFFFCFN